MTITVVNGPLNTYAASVVDLPPEEILGKALAGELGAVAALFPDRAAHIYVEATTTAAETGEVADLTTLCTNAALFPAGTEREVLLRYWAQDGEDRWWFERRYKVLGGTTPVIAGGETIENAGGFIAGAAVTYGNCHAVANFDSSDTAIVTTVGTSVATGGSTAGSSIGSISTNTATLTHPIARATHKRVKGVNASSDVATATEQLLATVFPATATTMSIYTADTATPTADGFDDDGRLEVEFYIEPPPNAFLTMNSNNVELHVSGDASDNVRHTCELVFGKLEYRPFQS
jgi:hypothetical protein